MRSGTPEDHAQRVLEAYDAVRDKWMAEGRYAELARAIIANWTSGNCVAYMAPLTRALVAAGEVELHRHLWTRTLKRQVASLFQVLTSMGNGKTRYVRLLNLDVAGFVETDPDSYRNQERAAAFLLQRLSADLQRWKDELRDADLPAEEPEQILRSLQQLKAPRIKVNRLPAVNPSRPKPVRGSA
jgi:hypothetical protein